jgi:subfamily B ATP-binding cassette protein MsbA
LSKGLLKCFKVYLGERQRLAIERAILKDAPILILDEATASLDTRAEREVQMAVEDLVKGRTTLVIAHRLSTIREADLIVVMSDGAIVEQGSHEELLARGGEYARLHGLQYPTARNF